MNESYVLNYPSEILFGNGRIQELHEKLPKNAKKILLVTGKHAENTGLVNEIIKMLPSRDVIAHCGISPEPPLNEVDILIKKGRENKSDAVIAVGGGSVIDAAKTAACLIPKEGLTEDYFYNRREIKEKGLFFAAIPTTAGTGAEITRNAVLTDPSAGIKQSIRHNTMVPDLAIIDPLLTLSNPPVLTAFSGLDAYTQAIESYVSKNACSISKSLALCAINKIYHNLPTAFMFPGNIGARLQMAEGSMITAMAFAQSGLGAVHGLAHPIGSLLKVPHGAACSILLVPILKWNLPACETEFAKIGRAIGFENAEDFIEKTVELQEKLGIPVTFTSYGLKEEHFDFILKNCRSNSMKLNPRHMEDSDITRILEELS
ncbi:MAG: hypothetical protein A2020_13820 [Lentisphaerae bacterium GWF2_45_14]|nr:MAG: hypothetical protein A2020_13820 [Lentisphaerae bacterium GWF2_45_14]